MNNSERAEKFIQVCIEALATGNMNWPIATEKLTSELDEAEAEVYYKAVGVGRTEGFASAIEKAAGMFDNDTHRQIAERIRAMAPEEKR